MIVKSATVESTETSHGATTFVPAGVDPGRVTEHGYSEEEWFASGTDDAGRPYRSHVFVRLPQDRKQFSGTLIVEPLHASGIAPVFMYSSQYVMRSGHGWVCVTSQKSALDEHVRPRNADRYESLRIETGPAEPGAPDIRKRPAYNETEKMAAWWAALQRHNQSSDAILAQVGAALRDSAGPCRDLRVGHLILAGHSQTGWVTTSFIRNAHESHRLADGAPIFDGYFPTGAPLWAFGPREVPLLQVISEGDCADPNYSFFPGCEGRQYRRPDSDDPADRFRLYELAGVPHMGTRQPPFNSAPFWYDFWQSQTKDNPLRAVDTMSSMPHNELFNMALDHLVRWVTRGEVPPRAERIHLDSDGFVSKDDHGNSRGGVRSVQLDVPRATYFPNPVKPDGRPWARGTEGIEVPFSAEILRSLYQDQSDYVRRFDLRLDELITEGWFLVGDAEGLRSEARAAPTF